MDLYITIAVTGPDGVQMMYQGPTLTTAQSAVPQELRDHKVPKAEWPEDPTSFTAMIPGMNQGQELVELYLNVWQWSSVIKVQA